MMDPKEKVGLERLLSGGTADGPRVMERENMLAHILAAPEVAATKLAHDEVKQPWHVRWFSPARMMPMGIGALGVALLAVGLPSSEPESKPEEFGVRGEARAITTLHTIDGVEVSASCFGEEKKLVGCYQVFCLQVQESV
ncbi:MAG: hypothetical protein GY822_01755 [Deltaproteobacteria bacterium]|nr:hypothetical protein [Deltaproteobacteria bacterium]